MTSMREKLDKLIYGGLLAFAMFLPVSISFAEAAWIFTLLVWMIRMFSGGDNFTRTGLDRPLFWLLAITAMGTITAVDPGHSFIEWRQITLVTVYWLVVSNIKSEEHLKKMVGYFITAAAAVSLFGILQYILGINMIDNVIVNNPYPVLQNLSPELLKHLALDHGRVIATRSHPLTCAESIMMVLIVALCLGIYHQDKKRRLAIWGMSLLMMVCLLFTNSRGPWLGTILGLLSLVFLRPSKKVIATVVAVLVIVPLLVMGLSSLTMGKRNSILDRVERIKDWRNDADSRERVLMWQSGREILKDHPLLGIGLGNIHEVYGQYKSAKAWHKGTENELHSNIVQIAVERGGLGLAAFIWLIIAFLIEGFKALKQTSKSDTFYKAVVVGGIAAIISFLCAGFTETTYNDSTIIMHFYFLMGVVMWISFRGSKKNDSGYSDIAVFMDRDGTISEEVGYINHPDRLKLLKRSAKAIKMLNNNKLRAVVVTNQAGVGRGYFKEEMIGVVHKKMEDLLAKEGAFLDAIYYCPHHPKDNCDCRKPKPGMMLQAKEKFGLDLAKCYVIGDKYSDVEYAHQVGAKGVLVLTGYGKGAYEYEKDQWSKGPDFVAGDLYDAVEWIIHQEKK